MSARPIEAAPPSPASAERVERLAVACLCAAALGLDLYAAGFYHLGFDETWHVFIAGVRPSAQFLRELQWESHPPLSYMILRWLVPLHGAELWPRLPSIVPGLGSIVLAYLAARELGMGRPARLVVAVMFALASTPVSIALTVRAYSLATMLTLAAFVFVLRILRDHRGTGPRERWGFVVAAVLAIWTEYSAVLTVLAMAAALAIHALRDRELRMAAVRGAARPSSWGPPLLLALGLVGVDRWLRWTRGRGQVGHVIDCFPAPGESLPGFALRGVTSTLDFFAPLGLASGRVPGFAIGLAAAAMLWLVVRYLRPGSPADGARSSVPAIIALVWTAIFVLAHDGVYPFGGRMRHQFVLFPFFAFALALVVDDALARLRRPPARALVALILAVWTTVTGVRGLRAGHIEEFSPAPTLWSAEIAPALRGWSEGDVLYTGRINAIAVFSHFKARPWKAEKRGPGDDLFHAKRTGEPTIRVLRSDEWWLPTPIDEKTAAELAAVMRRRGLTRVRVVAVSFAPKPIAARQDDEPGVRVTLAQQGLTLDRRFVFEVGEVLHVSETPRTAP